MKKAMITGITGQDGAYLSQLLIEKGYEVYGAFRRTSDFNTNKLKYLGIENEIKFLPVELLEFTNLYRAIEKVKPDEIYNLGAQSFVALSFEEPIFTTDVTALGPLRILEAMRQINPSIKFYQASSSEMFGKVLAVPQNEGTPFYPRSPYAVAKLAAHCLTINYRESYNIFACSGILFNHESPLRGLEFVTRKITHSVAKIKYGLQSELCLGNLDSKRDWGYAKEYVEAMWLMLQQKEADNYVISTGETHTVREFVEHAFEHIGVKIEWKGKKIEEVGLDGKTGRVLVRISPEFFRPTEVDLLIGDSSKARRVFGWEAKMGFKDLVSIMVDADLKNISNN